MSGLHKIHNLSARKTKRIFSNALNLEVEVSLEDIEQVIFDEFLSKLITPTALFLFDIKELEYWAILQLNPSICIFFVEYQSGGRSMKLEDPRDLTRIEVRVMGRIIDKLFTEITHIWSPYLNMSILDHIYESNPANIQASSYIPGIKITFKLKIGQVEVPFRVCYPYGLLKDEMLNSFDETNVTRKEEKNTLSANEQLQLINEMKNVHITTQAVLGETTMPIHRLLNLSEGDVIKLDQHINEPLGIKINRKVKLHGYPGEKNGKKAIKIFDQK